MKLATRRKTAMQPGRDGELIVVSADGQRCVSAASVTPTLQKALDTWEDCVADLKRLSHEVNAAPNDYEPLDHDSLLAPLPRAYEWLDASAYLSHVELVRKARGAELPANLRSDPLIYQGGSGHLLGPRAPLPLANEDWGMDFEAEICVVLADVAAGTRAADAAATVRLLMLANDVSLRHLIPSELEKGFGFIVSKPATAFSPFAVTPDELGESWKGGRVHLRMRTRLNGDLIGNLETGPEMHFSFFDLIAHIAQTRSFTAGTILGSGTVSNKNTGEGVACLAERRLLERVAHGIEETPYLTVGDIVQIEMLDDAGANIFGSIIQRVVAHAPSPDSDLADLPA